MLSAEVSVRTTRASRYLTQLCEHVNHIGGRHQHQPRGHGGGALAVQHVEHGNDHGVVTFAGGQCTLTATADTLTLRVEAADADTLQRAKDMFSLRLQTIGRRDELVVAW